MRKLWAILKHKGKLKGRKKEETQWGREVSTEHKQGIAPSTASPTITSDSTFQLEGKVGSLSHTIQEDGIQQSRQIGCLYCLK